jgi:hypothetical protein
VNSIIVGVHKHERKEVSWKSGEAIVIQGSIVHRRLDDSFPPFSPTTLDLVIVPFRLALYILKKLRACIETDSKQPRNSTGGFSLVEGNLTGYIVIFVVNISKKYGTAATSLLIVPILPYLAKLH